MPATLRPPPDKPRRRSPLRHSPYGLGLRDDRRNPSLNPPPGVTYVPTHERPIT